MFQSFFTLVVELSLWYFFVFTWFWGQIDVLMAQFRWCQSVSYKNDMLQAVLFVIATSIIQMIVDLPFKLYETFVIE